MNKNDVKSWLKDPYNLLFVLLMVFTIVFRLYYFSMTMNQPTWWDEGDYLAVGKEIALPSPERTEWWGHFAGMRPPLMPLVWALFIKFGIGTLPINKLPLSNNVKSVIPVKLPDNEQEK